MLVGVLHLALSWFDGTLDTLLGLAERAEIDVASLALAEVVCHCLAAVGNDGPPDADRLVGLVAAVSRLMLLKSAALLPRPTVPAAAPAEDAAMGAALEECLRQYRLFKLAAEGFRGREEEGLRSFPRLALTPPPALAPLPGNVSLDRLVAVVQEVLRRRPPDPEHAVPRYSVTVAERLRTLEATLEREGQVSFAQFIADSPTRIEVVVGFMAVLELIKRGRAAAEQREPFGDILIVARSPAAVAAD
jgi:segregation and condensation protein A